MTNNYGLGEEYLVVWNFIHPCAVESEAKADEEETCKQGEVPAPVSKEAPVALK